MDPQTPPIPNQPPVPTVPANSLLSPSKLYQVQSGGVIHSMKTVDIGEPHNTWKLAVLDVLTVIFAAAFGYSFAHYLAAELSFWFVVAALLVWGAFSVIEGFLQRNISRRLSVVLLESCALVVFFYAYAWQALAISAIAVLACLMWGYFSVRRELRNTIEVRFFTASGKVVGKVITAAAIFMVVMYASFANSNNNFFISQSSFNIFFDWTAGFVNNFYPKLPLSGTFGGFAQSIAQMQLQNNPAFQGLAPAEQSAALTQSADQIAAAFSNASNASTTPNASGTPTTATSTSPAVSATLAEPASNVFYSYLSALTTQLQEKFGTAFIGVWSLILFLILRSIGIIIVWITQFVSLIFYELLLATGFMKISEQPTTKEIIEI